MSTPRNAKELDTILKKGDWFAGLPAHFQNHLLTQGQWRSLNQGQTLFSAGDPGDGLYVVVNGSILVESFSFDGRMSLLGVIEAPHWFGEISMIDGQVRTHNAVANGHTTLWWVPRWVLEDSLEAEPALWRELAKLLSYKTRLVFQKLQGLSFSSARERVTHEIYLLSQRYGNVAESVKSPLIDLNQEQLAALCNLSRQKVNEILSDLQREGVISRHAGRIRILTASHLKPYHVTDEYRYPS